MQENMPKDPVMLLSFINLKLRDYYHNLDALCASLEISKEALVRKLETIDYAYDPDTNQFI